MVGKKRIICTVITDINYDQRMQRICTALSEQDYEVLLIGRMLSHSEKLSKQSYKQKRLQCLFNKGFLFYAEINIRFFFFLLCNRFDAVCSIDLDTILPGFLLSKLKRKVFIHDAHELFSEMPELDSRPVVKKVWTAIEQFVFPRMKYAYTESSGYQKVYHEKYPMTRFEVVRNVPFYYQAKRDKDDGYILYQGALNVGRGLEYAIEAMQHIDSELWLAGEGELSAILRQQVEQLQLQDKVKFLGWVKPLDLRSITQRAHIGINLLDINNRHYQLSFPNKLFDYIMAELPQISMNFPYYQEVTKHKSIGFLIDELSVESVYKALSNLQHNTEYYAKCVSHCKELKEMHNWNVEQQTLIDFYERIEWKK